MIDKYTHWFEWTLCDKCKLEFRREPEFTVRDSHMWALGGHVADFCQECVDKAGSVETLFEEYIGEKNNNMPATKPPKG